MHAQHMHTQHHTPTLLLRYLTPDTPGHSLLSTPLLKKAGLEDATAVVVAGLGDQDRAGSDAYVTAALLQVCMTACACSDLICV